MFTQLIKNNFKNIIQAQTKYICGLASVWGLRISNLWWWIYSKGKGWSCRLGQIMKTLKCHVNSTMTLKALWNKMSQTVFLGSTVWDNWLVAWWTHITEETENGGDLLWGNDFVQMKNKKWRAEDGF